MALTPQQQQLVDAIRLANSKTDEELYASIKQISGERYIPDVPYKHKAMQINRLYEDTPLTEEEAKPFKLFIEQYNLYESNHNMYHFIGRQFGACQFGLTKLAGFIARATIGFRHVSDLYDDGPDMRDFDLDDLRVDFKAKIFNETKNPATHKAMMDQPECVEQLRDIHAFIAPALDFNVFVDHLFRCVEIQEFMATETSKYSG